jgi:hypothetical protein
VNRRPANLLQTSGVLRAQLSSGPLDHNSACGPRFFGHNPTLRSTARLQALHRLTRSVFLPLHVVVRTVGSAIFALSRSLCVRVRPWIDQASLNGVPLEVSGKTDTIATTLKEMGATDAPAKVTAPIARLRRSLLSEIFFEASDVGDALDLGVDAEPRPPQRIGHVPIAEEYDMGVQLRSGLEYPHAVRRDATSRLLPCNPFLIVGDLLSA